MPPYFSIVIPTYNRLNYLKGSVDSVLNQTFRNFELLIVDDGSTDGTAETIRRDYAGEARLKVLVQANSERGAARNKGLRESTGIYVLFIDSDDLMLPDHLETLHTYIHQLGEPDFIATKYLFIRDGKSRLSGINFLKEGYYDYRFFLNGNPLGCNICLRRSNPDLHPFVEDRKYAIKEDWMFNLQNLRYNKMYLIDKVTIHMNDHDDRSMRSDNSLIIQKTAYALEWLLQNVELSPQEQSLLRSHGYYFMAVHSRIDGKTKEALSFLKKAVETSGWEKKYLILWLKCKAGSGLMNWLRKIARRNS